MMKHLKRAEAHADSSVRTFRIMVLARGAPEFSKRLRLGAVENLFQRAERDPAFFLYRSHGYSTAVATKAGFAAEDANPTKEKPFQIVL